MGQKVSPIGFRTGITIGWKSRWFAPKSNYGEFLVEDEKLRRFIDNRLNKQPPYAAISEIGIERTREEVKITLKTARPGLVIGPKGAEVEKLKNALEDMTDRRVNINIAEIKQPDLNASLVASGIAEQLKRRASFRRTLKQRAEATMQAGAKGVKIMVSGRLGGAEIARSEMVIKGSIPLHTLEADVDYGFVPSFTTYGVVGVKVWIYRGRFGEVQEEEQQQPAGMTRARRRHERGGSGGGRPGGRSGGRRGGKPGAATPDRPAGLTRRGGRIPDAPVDAPVVEQAKPATEEVVETTPAVEPQVQAPPAEVSQESNENKQD